MRTVISFLLFFLLTLTCSVQASVFRISSNGGGDYTTITSAYNAAVAGDTLLISQGAYNESIYISRRTVILGAGFDLATLTNNIGHCITFAAGASGSVLEGLNINQQGYNLIALQLTANADLVQVRRCRIRTETFQPVVKSAGGTCNRLVLEDCILISTYTGGDADALSIGADTVTVRNCLFTQANTTITYANALSGNPRNLVVSNCVFLSWAQIFDLASAAPIVFMNNIAYDWSNSPAWGSYPAGSIFDYNASSSLTPPGSNGMLLSSNPFESYNPSGIYQPGVSNLHLASGSVCIDAGSPSVLDRDSTRSDLGLYGGPTPMIDTGAPAYPFAVSINFDSAIIPAGDTLHYQTTGRIGPNY